MDILDQQIKPWYEIKGAAGINTPALIVYPNRVKQNIQTAISIAGNAGRLRPHVKTNKTIEVTEFMIEAGIRKFKCATIAEAEMLGMAKAPDVMLAYQPVGPNAKRLLKLITKYPSTKFSCIVDDISIAENLGKTFNAGGYNVAVYVDLNVGMNRTGIEPGAKALELYRICKVIEGITPIGWHAYDGNQRDPDIEKMEKAVNEAFRGINQMSDVLVQEGFAQPELVAGGSPTFPVHAKQGRECSPGTFVFWDAGYLENCPSQPFLPAALVITRVVSLPSPERVCVDLGYKSIASENEYNKRIRFINMPDLKPVAHSEEHLVLSAPAGHTLKPGDLLYGIPYHICPTVALYDEAIVIANHEVAGKWKIIARKRKLKT